MYLCKTELFEIELFICIKMDLALNKLQRLICYLTKTNKLGEKKLFKSVVEGWAILYEKHLSLWD